MSYTKATDFASKDALLTGNPAKVIKGTELGAEFDAIVVADALNVKSTVSGSAKTLTVSNSLTLAGTDGTTMTFPGTSATIARTDAANTFTGTQTIGALVATTVNGNTVSTGTGTITLGAGSTLATSATNSITLTSTGATNVTLPTTGTLATLAGTEELDNKTLDSSVGKGTWTASGTWTLPALTLGGTVSGGGNQLNNVIIGTTTPLAGSFTTLSATSSVALAATQKLYLDGVAASGDTYIHENSANSLQFVAGGTAAATATSTGLAVTGTLSATGQTNLDAGTVAAPGLVLEGETGTGLYRIGANNHGYAVSGAKVLDIATGAVKVSSPVMTVTVNASDGATTTTYGNRESRLFLTAAGGYAAAGAGPEIVFGKADTTTYRGGSISYNVIAPDGTGETGNIAVALKATNGTTSLTKVAEFTPTGFSVTDATDATSTTVASLKTAGGLGVAKKLYVGDNIVMASGKALQTVAGYIEGSEMTAPAAGAANTFRIFAEDNGAGKTRLMVQFATGAAQQIAIEP